MTTKIVELPKRFAAWGYIVGMIHPNNDEPLWKQIDRNYQHGGGWRPQDKWSFEERDGVMYAQYPGDPELEEIDRLRIGDETLHLFPHSYILWTKGDEKQMARCD